MSKLSDQRAFFADQRARASQSVMTGWLDSFRPDSTVSWRECDAECLLAAIAAVTEAGHALTFGRTSDGGALSVTLLAGGTPHKLYPSTAAQAEDLMSRLAHTEAPTSR